MPTSENDLLARTATNLRALREQRGFTREQLAATTDVDAQMIKRIESGRANPALTVLSRLASALMISLSLLISEPAAALATNFSSSESDAFESDVVGETIVSLRKQRHVSRRALARMVDLRTGTLQRYESGDTDARLLAIEPIARALAIDSIDFVREVERRQHAAELSSGEWSTHAEGVEFRLVSSTGRAQLWEWRLAPAAEVVEGPSIGIGEEIATTIRGTVVLELGEERHILSRGGSAVVPNDHARRFTNTGESTARLLRFQVRN